MHARWRTAFLFVAVLGASARVAHAQPAPLVAQAQPNHGAGDGDAKEKSRAAFRKGVAQLRASDWSGARASFEAAYALFPHPSILLNLAIARLRTDDPVRAEQDLVKFLSEDGGASADELASAREALADARSRLGTLRVIVSPAAARVAIDQKAVETVRRADAGATGVVAEVRIKPGRHAVDVEADGFTANHRTVDIVAKTEAAITIELPPKEQATVKPPAERHDEGISPRTIVGYSLAGLAGVALITGGVVALRAKSLSNDYGDPSNTRFQDPGTRSSGIGFRTAADVSLGIAILSGVAAIVLLVTDVGRDTPTATAAGFRDDALLRW